MVELYQLLGLNHNLLSQLEFLKEIEALKTVVRQTLILDGSRLENDAEHSWELAVMAMVLGEYAPAGTDMSKVIAMVLVHDLVEIYAGDAYAYDAAANEGQDERERLAADRLFGRLPLHQSEHLRGLWEEFEARFMPEAKFARALDRLQPLLHNYYTEGRMWRVHQVVPDMVRHRIAPIGEISWELADLAETIVVDAERRGFFTP